MEEMEEKQIEIMTTKKIFRHTHTQFVWYVRRNNEPQNHSDSLIELMEIGCEQENKKKSLNFFRIAKDFPSLFFFFVFDWPSRCKESKTHDSSGVKEHFFYGLNNVNIITHMSCDDERQKGAFCFLFSINIFPTNLVVYSIWFFHVI